MRTFETTTKEELIAALNDLPDGALVAFASNYGDRCGTQQLHSIKPRIEEMPYRESAYSDSGFAIEDESENEDGDAPTVFVIE